MLSSLFPKNQAFQQQPSPVRSAAGIHILYTWDHQWGCKMSDTLLKEKRRWTYRDYREWDLDEGERYGGSAGHNGDL
jgi:hypothetical protein